MDISHGTWKRFVTEDTTHCSVFLFPCLRVRACVCACVRACVLYFITVLLIIGDPIIFLSFILFIFAEKHSVCAPGPGLYVEVHSLVARSITCQTEELYSLGSGPLQDALRLGHVQSCQSSSHGSPEFPWGCWSISR